MQGKHLEDDLLIEVMVEQWLFDLEDQDDEEEDWRMGEYDVSLVDWVALDGMEGVVVVETSSGHPLGDDDDLMDGTILTI